MSIKDNNPHPDKALQLVTSGSSLVAQEVQRASRQLALAGRIGTQLVLNDERRRWVALLSSIKTEDAVKFLSRRVSLSQDLLERHIEHWDWEGLSQNKSIPWSLELLECFDDHWDWGRLRDMDRFDERVGLSDNESLPWSMALLEHFKDRWNWGFFDSRYYSSNVQSGLSTSKTLPWSLELLEYFKDHWDWGCLSSNDALPWSLELLECFENNWIWQRRDMYNRCDDGEGAQDSETCGLSENRSLPWSIELLERFEERWDWRGLSANESLAWSMELLVRFKDRWVWPVLSLQQFLPWADLLKLFDVTNYYLGRQIPESYWQKWLGDPNTPRKLLEQYKDQWEWSILSESDLRDYFEDENGWLNWLEHYEDKWDWVELSQITPLVFESDSLPWSISLLRSHEDREELKTILLLGISHSESASWSIELLDRIDRHFDEDRHNDRWDWEGSSEQDLSRGLHKEIWRRLSNNKSLPWSQELTERFEYLRNSWEQKPVVWSIEKLERIKEDWEWDWDCLSSEASLPWSIELLERFEDRWDWRELSRIGRLPWSVELIERFKERWDWRYLTTQNIYLPKLPLTAQDIDEIMSVITKPKS